MLLSPHYSEEVSSNILSFVFLCYKENFVFYKLNCGRCEIALILVFVWKDNVKADTDVEYKCY